MAGTGHPANAPNVSTALFVGLDDTDMPGTPGTNQLARRLAASLPQGVEFVIALRHQLLLDPRVPYTSQNGSASLLLRADSPDRVGELFDVLGSEVRAWYVPGSDPALCIACGVPGEVIEFGRRCQRELVRQRDATSVAQAAGLRLEAFGGTGDGMIGALAAVGLLAGRDDGRVVHRAGWTWPDPFCGVQPLERVLARGVDDVREYPSGRRVSTGTIDVGKHLRPAYRQSRVVMFVEPCTPVEPGGGTATWRAVKLN